MLGEWNLRGLILNVKRLHRVCMYSFQGLAFYSRCSADSMSLRLEMKVIGLKLLTPDGSFRTFLPGVGMVCNGPFGLDRAMFCQLLQQNSLEG